jgi:hypothetical protein
MSESANESILNEGLELAMAFGTDWLKPIKERLALLHPELTQAELNRYDTVCRKTMKIGHEWVYKKLASVAKERKKIKHKDLEAEVQKILLQQYPWINSSNFAKLLSQSIYYAYKDGLHEAIE